MSPKDRLCVHCGRYISDPINLVPCVIGGNAHRRCEEDDIQGDHS